MRNTKRSGEGTRIRWAIGRDHEAMAAIEEANFPGDGLVKADIDKLLADKLTIGIVVELDGEPVGHSLYFLGRDRISVLTLCVDPRLHRRGFGSLLVSELSRKLQRGRRELLVVTSRDGNLPAHLFLRACGFTATRVLRQWCIDKQDAYLFEMDWLTAARLAARRTLVNRIKDFIA